MLFCLSLLASARVFHKYTARDECSSATCTWQPARTAPPRVIIDTDVDFDDDIALLALLSPLSRAEILGISVTGCGATHVDRGVANVLHLLALTPNRTIPWVARGAASPLSFSNVFPWSIRSCADALYSQKVPPTRADVPVLPDLMDAYRRALAVEEDGAVTILSIGGATNINAVQQALPELFRAKVGRVVIMGGALPPELGNVQYAFPDVNGTRESAYGNTVAEWNVFIDPLAFQHMLETLPQPPEVVATNACNFVPVNDTLVARLQALPTPAAQLAAGILASPCITSDPSAGLHLLLWDPLAALVVLDPTLICTEALAVDVGVVLQEGADDLSGGLTLNGKSPIAGGVCASANRALDLLVALLGSTSSTR